MTNDFFDSKRFFCYLSKLWTEQRRTLLISAAILLGILFVIELWSCATSYNFVYYPSDSYYLLWTRNCAFFTICSGPT